MVTEARRIGAKKWQFMNNEEVRKQICNAILVTRQNVAIAEANGECVLYEYWGTHGSAD